MTLRRSRSRPPALPVALAAGSAAALVLALRERRRRLAARPRLWPTSDETAPAPGEGTRYVGGVA